MHLLLHVDNQRRNAKELCSLHKKGSSLYKHKELLRYRYFQAELGVIEFYTIKCSVILLLVG